MLITISSIEGEQTEMDVDQKVRGMALGASLGAIPFPIFVMRLSAIRWSRGYGPPSPPPAKFCSNQSLAYQGTSWALGELQILHGNGVITYSTYQHCVGILQVLIDNHVMRKACPHLPLKPFDPFEDTDEDEETTIGETSMEARGVDEETTIGEEKSAEVPDVVALSAIVASILGDELRDSYTEIVREFVGVEGALLKIQTQISDLSIQRSGRESGACSSAGRPDAVGTDLILFDPSPAPGGTQDPDSTCTPIPTDHLKHCAYGYCQGPLRISFDKESRRKQQAAAYTIAFEMKHIDQDCREEIQMLALLLPSNASSYVNHLVTPQGCNTAMSQKLFEEIGWSLPKEHDAEMWIIRILSLEQGDSRKRNIKKLGDGINAKEVLDHLNMNSCVEIYRRVGKSAGGGWLVAVLAPTSERPFLYIKY